MKCQICGATQRTLSKKKQVKKQLKFYKALLFLVLLHSSETWIIKKKAEQNQQKWNFFGQWKDAQDPNQEIRQEVQINSNKKNIYK
jgi:hypothetical protein